VGGEVKPNDTAADDVVGPVQNELANTKLEKSINPEEENTQWRFKKLIKW
jgi:hypothetical protein